MTRVLVVEDDVIISADLAETLRRLGYDVPATADSAETALRALDQYRPDVVLMDIRLRGGIDGIDTATRMHQRSDVPVVYLTAHTDESTLARAKETAPHGYLVKPFQERDLRTTIEVALRKHELERHLAARERWFSTTLSSLGDAVIATDPEGCVSFMNAAAKRLTGFELEASRDRPLSEVVRLVDEAGNPLVDRLGRAQPGRSDAEFLPDALLIDRAGKRRLVDQTATPIVDDQGGVLGRVLVLRDLTERKRLERRLDVAERLASLGSMASRIAHELNNPLAAVMGNLTFALEELNSLGAQVTAGGLNRSGGLDSCREALQDAAECAERMRKIIDKMRLFVSNRSPLREVVEIPDLLEQAVVKTSDAIRRKARLTRAFGSTPRVYVDESQLLQVLVHLLTNAVDAIPEGRVADHEIKLVTYTDSRGRAAIEVRDSGVGIRQADMARIFDPFFSTKQLGSGMGLGLAICHSFVSGAGGELSVESELGHGSTLRVALPPASLEAAPGLTVAAVAPVTRRARILVLDDELAVSRIIERLLSEHEVVVETDGHGALSRIESGESFDAILCDMMMPALGGDEVYAALRQANPAQAAKMVFMTGGTISPRAGTFLDNIQNPVLTKPFALDKLRAVIGTLLTAAR